MSYQLDDVWGHDAAPAPVISAKVVDSDAPPPTADAEPPVGDAAPTNDILARTVEDLHNLQREIASQNTTAMIAMLIVLTLLILQMERTNSSLGRLERVLQDLRGPEASPRGRS